MASAAETRERERFLTIKKEEDIEALLDSTSSENSKRAVKYSVNEFCETKCLNLEAAAASKVDLNRILTTFYAAARTQKNDTYRKISMLSIRYGIQKHFEKCSKIDIINDDDFKEANKVFSAMLVQVKKSWKG